MSKYEALFHEQLEDIKLIFDKIAIFVGLNIKFILIFVLPIIVGLVILTAQTNSSKGTSPFFDSILKLPIYLFYLSCIGHYLCLFVQEG